MALDMRTQELLERAVSVINSVFEGYDDEDEMRELTEEISEHLVSQHKED